MLRISKLIILLFFILFIYSCEKSIDYEGSLDGDGTYSLDGSTSTNGNSNGIDYEPGTMTAGEWNDLENWFFWKDLIQGNDWYPMQSYWSFYTTKRYSFLITDINENPVINATVTIEDSQGEQIWKTKSDNSGYAHLFSSLFNQNNNPEKVRVIYGNHETNINVFNLYDYGLNLVSLPIETSVPDKINIQFVVDATGSMSDEINYLKAELEDVISNIQNQFANMELSVSSVFYRDEGDAYVVETLPFTSDITNVLSFVNDHNAGGGGDFPEAVHTALNTAVSEQWDTEAICRIMFLILDAPPHYNNQVIDDIQNSIRTAAEMGIKVIPITASGIDKETEFLMRFMAISTNGTYCFITNHSGVGNDHLEPTVGQYSIEYLNELIIRLITENTTR